MVSKKKKAVKKATPKKDDQPVRLDMTFEQAIKLAATTPIKKKSKK